MITLKRLNWTWSKARVEKSRSVFIIVAENKFVGRVLLELITLTILGEQYYIWIVSLRTYLRGVRGNEASRTASSSFTFTWYALFYINEAMGKPRQSDKGLRGLYEDSDILTIIRRRKFGWSGHVPSWKGTSLLRRSVDNPRGRIL